jgi:hypothetical protein
LINGLDYKAYTCDDLKDLSHKYIGCNCPVCIATPLLMRGSKGLPSRNLYMFGVLVDAFDEAGPDIYLYDLITDHHEDILVLPGLYVGSKDSRYIDALKLIKSIKPEHLVLLGNTFYTGGDIEYDMWIDFIDRLKGITEENERRFRGVNIAITNMATYPLLNSEEKVDTPGIGISSLEVDSKINAGGIHINGYGKARMIIN